MCVDVRPVAWDPRSEHFASMRIAQRPECAQRGEMMSSSMKQ